MTVKENYRITPPAQHSFHLVEPSAWPILTAFSLLFLAIGAVMYLHYKGSASNFIFIAGFIVTIACLYGWWYDVVKEGRKDRAHTKIVQNGLRVGMALFILSEVMFFFAFFLAYFNVSIWPMPLLEEFWPKGEGVWPPANIVPFDPWDIPFMNTIILLLSGTTITWAHYALIENNQKDLVRGLGFTILLGIFFSIMQAVEYAHAPFHFKDGIYASNFYMITGFHGAHVIIGTIFLLICYIRARKGHFTSADTALGLEFAAWYWHFVDIVWLFVFMFIYILGR